jgi:hypothetical protein
MQSGKEVISIQAVRSVWLLLKSAQAMRAFLAATAVAANVRRVETAVL